jgi:excisionase family DNA binding protein
MAQPGYRRQIGRVVPSGHDSDRTDPNGSNKDEAMVDRNSPDALLTPAEVAQMFRVNPKTVTRWARAGKITAIRTLGGHRRFRRSEIEKFLAEAEHGAL